MSRYHRQLSRSRWSRVRRQILEQAAWTCQVRTPGVCTVAATQVDHVIPLSSGGSPYDEANLRASCAACNLDRLARTPKVHNPWGL